MKTETTHAPAAIKDKQSSSKKSKQLKMLMSTLNDLNHEVYICLKDKKSKQFVQFSSDKEQFGLDQIHKLVGKQEVKPIEKLQRHISQLQQPNQHTTTISDELSANSKKQTDASSSQQKSVDSPNLSNADCSDKENRYTPMDINQFKDGFKIFDQKAHFEFGNNKLTSLLAPESLSHIDLHNEMSYQEEKPHSSNLLDINQVSYNPDEESSFLLHEHPHIGFSKKFQEDDIGLRIDSTVRRANVFNYMSKSGALADEDSECMSGEDYSCNDQSDCSETYQPNSNETSGYQVSNFLDTNECVSPLPIVKNKSTPVEYNEASKEAALSISSKLPELHKTSTDMFFSCADWETQVKESQVENFDQLVEQIVIETPKKRIAKCIHKFGNTDQPGEAGDEFDVDTVMKKIASPNKGFRTIQTKRYFRNKKRPQRLSMCCNRDDPSTQPFMDVSLSPMGSPSCSPFEFPIEETNN